MLNLSVDHLTAQSLILEEHVRSTRDDAQHMGSREALRAYGVALLDLRFANQSPMGDSLPHP